jgi:hypothetical protein
VTPGHDRLPPLAASRRTGLEHEFRVSDARGQVDFRGVIHDLRLGQPNLDPADPNAYRLKSGAALTCDGREAEIALPPIVVRPGFSDEVRLRADNERHALSGLLPGRAVEGVSTHLSVSIPDELAKPVCSLYARTFAPLMMLLLDRRDSPGLLIRPRPGRVELGGEYVAGEQLAVATLFAVGSVLACERALRGRDEMELPSWDVRLEAARARYGWYVDRSAFGPDLYESGRSTLLRTVDGHELLAQEALELGWRAARVALGQLAARDELDLAGRAVSGESPLPSEVAHSAAEQFSRSPLPPDPYGSAVRLRQRPGAEIAPVMLTWDACAFVVLDRQTGRTAFAVVPGALLGGFLHDLDSGRLDSAIHAFMRRSPTGSRPASLAGLDRPRLFDEIGTRLALVPAEYGADGQPVAPIDLLASRAA